MKPIHAVFAAAISLLLAACYPPSTVQPIGKFTNDPKVRGLWLSTPVDKEQSPAYYHFLPQKDGSITVMIVEANAAKPGGEWSLASLTTAAVGPNTFMNTRLIESNGKPESGSPHNTMPMLYKFDAGGRMHVYFLDEKATKAAIKAAKIEGTVGDGDSGDATITADQATADKFLTSKEGLALFSKEFVVLTKKD